MESEKPPVLGLVQRNGLLALRLLNDVQQKTIRPIIKQLVSVGSLIYTDEYNIYSRLKEWGYAHKTVCHAAGEYARDEDGDGFCEVHVNTRKISGPSFAHGYVHIVEYVKKDCPSIWASLNSSIILGAGEKPS